MFATLFKPKNKQRASAEKLYYDALLHTREPSFYESYGVPDTLDGRFDLLLIHLFIVLNRRMNEEGYEQLAQALFDVTFKDMDQTLREIGIGDTGMKRHMKRMMRAFNGRMHAYQYAVAPETLSDKDIEGLPRSTLEQAIKRNLYATVSDNEEWDEKVVDKMSQFMRTNLGVKDKEIDRASFIFDDDNIREEN